MLKRNLEISTFLCVSYGIIFVFGSLGNSLVLATFVKNPALKTTTNIFISNLAVADLLVTVFCVPFTLAANLLTEWPFGGILCKLVAYAQAVAVNASINTLVAISIDRCLSIYKPFGYIFRKKMVVIFLILIWIFPLIFMAPWLFVFSVKSISNETRHKICSDFWESRQMSDAYFITVNLILSYILPLLIISICYIIMYRKIRSRQIPGEICPIQRRSFIYNSKIKLIKMILIVIISFAISWLPLYTLFVFTKFLDYPDTTGEIYQFQFLFPFAQWLAATNSSTNPIIYTCYSRKFRTELKNILQNILHVKSKKGINDVVWNTDNECIIISSTEYT